MAAADYREVMAVRDLRDWMRDSLTRAMQRQQVAAEAHTEHYMVNLLTVYSRADNLFAGSEQHRGLRPLALLLADAFESRTAEARHRALQRIGDIALFIAGFFADSLQRKLVDVDYYIRMGGTAYQTLADTRGASLREQIMLEVYAELAEKFTEFVDVIAEVAQHDRVFSERDILRLYDVWIKTGSKRAERLLKDLGVTPSEGAISRRAH